MVNNKQKQTALIVIIITLLFYITWLHFYFLDLICKKQKQKQKHI